MKAISFGELTAEEKKEIYKTIVRFHKEHGTLANLKEKRMSLSWYENRPYNAIVHSKFIEIIWSPLKSYYIVAKGLKEFEACLKASIETIKFAEQFYNSNKENFNCIGSFSILNEFDFVYQQVNDFYESLEEIPINLKDEFRELWRLHKGIAIYGENWYHKVIDKFKDFFPDR